MVGANCNSMENVEDCLKCEVVMPLDEERKAFKLTVYS